MNVAIKRRRAIKRDNVRARVSYAKERTKGLMMTIDGAVKDALSDKDDTISGLVQENEELKAKIDTMDMTKRVQILKDSVRSRDETIQSFRDTLAQRDMRIRELEEMFATNTGLSVEKITGLSRISNQISDILRTAKQNVELKQK